MATLKGTETKYIPAVLKHIKEGKKLKFGPQGKLDEIKVIFTKELQKAYKEKDLDKAMKLFKDKSQFKHMFTNGEKSYRWTEIFKGTFSGASRKNSTAASDVNESFTLFFMTHKKIKTFAETTNFLTDNKTKHSGILKGNNKSITYGDLLDLLLKDDSAQDDIKIAQNNALEVLKDINNKIVKNYYWCPREKPNGVPSSHPSDIVLEFKDSSMMGYSNKAIKGSKDETPKFNTSVTSFYKTNNTTQKKINKIIDDSWLEVQNKLPVALQNLFSDIKKEPYTESGSKKLFKDLGKAFSELNKDFYKEDFYWPYRNLFIKNFTNFLEKDKNFEDFLNIVYLYTYTDAASMLPYKLLVGSTQGSKITPISSNEELKKILSAKKLNKKKITYDGKSQSFLCEGTLDKTNFYFNVTCRTRTSGGWSGKSLFITTPGIKIK